MQSKIKIEIGIFLFRIESIFFRLFKCVQQEIINLLTNFPNTKSDKNLHKLKAFFVQIYFFFIQTKWKLGNKITITLKINIKNNNMFYGSSEGKSNEKSLVWHQWTVERDH